MKAIVVSGGTPPSCEMLNNELRNSDLLICADSGANCLYSYGISPNYLIGDFDSVDKRVLDFFKNSNCLIETYPSHKNETDTELAIDKALELGSSSIVLLGCTGTRFDHILGNIGLLKKCLLSGTEACIIDSNNIIMLKDKSFTIYNEAGTIFSISAYCDEVKKLTIKNAKYPLMDYDLRLGDPLTISNEFAGLPVEVTFEDGMVLFMISHD